MNISGQRQKGHQKEENLERKSKRGEGKGERKREAESRHLEKANCGQRPGGGDQEILDEAGGETELSGCVCGCVWGCTCVWVRVCVGVSGV